MGYSLFGWQLTSSGLRKRDRVAEVDKTSRKTLHADEGEQAAQFVVGRDESGQTPLHVASRNGDIDEVQRILRVENQHGNDDYLGQSIEYAVCAVDHHHNTPLRNAVLSENVEVVEAILEHLKAHNLGGLVNAADQWLRTPLSYAAELGNQDIVNALINSGADIHIVDHNQELPLHHAVRNKHEGVVVALLKEEENQSSSLGPMIDQASYQGLTPIDIAKSANNPQVKLILELKAYIAKREQQGEYYLRRGFCSFFGADVSKFSKSKKLAAAKALLANNMGDSSEGLVDLTEHSAALNDGELGRIASRYNKALQKGAQSGLR